MRRRASAAAAGRRRRRRFRSCRRRPAPAARIRRWTTSRRRNEGTPRRRPPAMSETARAPLVSRTPAAPAAAPPVPAEASSVRSVRDALGNRGFACFLQAKLTVGHPDDPLEREADDVAEQVMRMPDESVSTQGMSPPAVQRKCAECEQADEDEQSMRVQTKRDGPAAMTSASSDIASRIAALGGRGDPLAPGIRSYFEPRFGRDLGAVRTHTGADADETSRAIGARAYTYGTDVAFRAGEFSPETVDGQRLLAHELTHVIQQSDGRGIGGTIRRATGKE